MANYKECPYCGASLDPEEKCDCRNDSADKEEREKKEDNHYVRSNN